MPVPIGLFDCVGFASVRGGGGLWVGFDPGVKPSVCSCSRGCPVRESSGINTRRDRQNNSDNNREEEEEKEQQQQQIAMTNNIIIS